MKKIIVAIDSFKGSLSSLEANRAAARGIRKIFHSCKIDEMPIADGGEGMLDLFIAATHGSNVSLHAHDPLNRLITTTYGLSSDGQTALIEMARISGLSLLKEAERNPWLTTSYGTGELIADALSKGYRNFIIGIGGSATTDCGLGMLQALGFHFLDKEGHTLGTGGKIMDKVSQIDTTQVMPELKEATFTVACDVNNPLYGKNGAAYVYAPQKGADTSMIERLDHGLRHIAKVIRTQCGKNLTVAGAGAAGGMGAAFMGFLEATLQPGIQLSLDLSNFEQRAKEADLIITGEGAIDRQSLMGKVLDGVLARALPLQVPVIAIAGSITDLDLLTKAGFAGIYAITPAPISLSEAMKADITSSNITNTVSQLCSLIHTFTA